MPNVLTDLIARLQGKTAAYDTTEDVAALLRDQTVRLTGRALVHHAGAARLADELAYQPGLIDLRGEQLDGALYLQALADAARAHGHRPLADRLQDAAVSARETAALVSIAAHATVSAHGTPVTEAA
ncbi:hypothetical protein E4198_00105 [Streptomyces sp. RKND-216]|uniref:hypothetical protein n=1 Tax=Streptomyces sp. RKND-216 TaxID=2562581 RepID=UPI00109DE2A0|nr:hypothetical protein [Streptomyces sp. RKND-216]THA28252.1 hypothetical protein E4198_00105 [Streptomyces sp. RKND-216]